ncbi:hypothetical protein [Nocardioides sp.]|uniref:hypothetical protein n=1 Tax=Nocardioides sp. TaxID=35761 RepID=UPI0025CCF747|nr:hypothetical protein [Nocardioides sp.]
MRAEQYARAANNLRAFLDTFNELLPELEPVGRGDLTSFQILAPRRGHEARADALCTKLALLTGAASYALEAAGIYMDYKPPGTWETTPINPVAVWSTMLDRTPMLNPTMLSQMCLQGVGLLEHMRDEQAEKEKGLIGAIAWFLTLGPRIRDAAGLPPRSTPGFIVTSLVVVAQGVIVAAIGGALAYPIAGWLGLLPQ